MDDSGIKRRDFLVDSGRIITAGWLALQLPWLGALAGCAREDAKNGSPLTGLKPSEERAMRAFAAQIIPADEHGPGAVELGAVHFVDRALAQPFFAEQLPLIREGLADLDARARKISGRSDFAALPHAQQVAVLRDIERGPFFKAARTLVVIGTFAEPAHGGNKDGAGWAMIGIDHRPSYDAPFGWYDAQSSTRNVA